MKKLYSFLSCGLLSAAAMTSVSSYAVNQDQITVTKDGVSLEYWNDFKNDVNANDVNKLYPNWRVNVGKDNETYPQGTTGTINWVYKYADGTMIKDGATGGTIGNDGTYHNYIDLGVLPNNGEVQALLTLTLVPAGATNPTIIVFDPIEFSYTKVEADPNQPTAVLTWTVVPGVNESYFDYTVTTENIDTANATFKVWADRPDNLTADESNAQSGRLVIKMTSTNETLWVKANVTLADGTVITAKGNDTGVQFTCTLDDPDIYTLTCSDAEVLSATTGKFNYTITGDLSKATSVELYAVTNVYGADVEVGRIDNVTENSGSMEISGLKPGAENHVWVKMNVTLADGSVQNVQYPGEAQGYDGFVFTTQNTAVEAVEAVEADAVYYNLQGVKVANPSKGLYIRVHGKKATKVLVNE